MALGSLIAITNMALAANRDDGDLDEPADPDVLDLPGTNELVGAVASQVESPRRLLDRDEQALVERGADQHGCSGGDSLTSGGLDVFANQLPRRPRLGSEARRPPTVTCQAPSCGTASHGRLSAAKWLASGIVGHHRLPDSTRPSLPLAQAASRVLSRVLSRVQVELIAVRAA